MREPHGFAPLTIEEIELAVACTRPHLSDSAVFCSIALVEPPKTIFKNDEQNHHWPRKVRLVGFENTGPNHDGGFDAEINLETQHVELKRIEIGQAPIGFSDVVQAIQLTKQDVRWQQAMRRRGITDFEHVQIDPWPAGGFLHPSIPEGHRAHRAISFVREDGKDNGYAHPVHGLIAHVDLTEGKVAHVEDHGITAIPTESGRYESVHQIPHQNPLSTLEIRQPDGPEFSVENNFIQWRNWEFRVSLHPVNGLVIHRLGFREKDRLRPILHRAALSDMVVPYGDTDPMHSWKHVLDAGEASLGNCVNSLSNGCDCLGEITYLDHTAVKSDGFARKIDRAICIHEEDFGVLWKHHDAWARLTEVRRSRRLVISSFFTVGNYDYGFYWYLYLDGTIQMEVKLTGIVGVSDVRDGEGRPEMSPLIAPNLASPIHQHLFCFRLDFELDGTCNSVYEVDTESVPISRENPHGTAFGAKSTLLRKELDARRKVNESKARTWKIENSHRRNRLGIPVAYKLVPSATTTSFAPPESPVAHRAGFAKFNLWVTPCEEDKLCAAGDFPNLHPGMDGLPQWTQQNRDITDRDIVVWHTFGSTHLPRPEDWPVMPVETCGFTLQPTGFFDRNPTLDLPPPGNGSKVD